MQVVRRRLFAFLVTLVITLAGLLVASGTASADLDGMPIVSAHSGMCLNLARWDTSDGAAIIQWPCGGGNNERWNLIFHCEGCAPASSVVNRYSRKCLDIIGTSNGAPVTQRGCHDNDGRQGWYMKYKGSSHGWWYYTFENIHTRKCLEVPNGTMDCGAAIQVWDCNGNPTQLWRIPRFAGD
jgi:Ricin-type beta-trefoil lectin domain